MRIQYRLHVDFEPPGIIQARAKQNQFREYFCRPFSYDAPPTMIFFRMTFLTVTFFLVSALFPLISAIEDDVGYRNPKQPMTEEEWRNEHQYEGRNSGGWRHANWQGGVDTIEPSEKSDGSYGGNGRRWKATDGPRPYIEGEINGNETPYYDPNYYNEHPYESNVLQR
ncbi:MAG: hypothetical protein WCG42_04675 [Parachlamydiaceae bacterium]